MLEGGGASISQEHGDQLGSDNIDIFLVSHLNEPTFLTSITVSPNMFHLVPPPGLPQSASPSLPPPPPAPPTLLCLRLRRILRRDAWPILAGNHISSQLSMAIIILFHWPAPPPPPPLPPPPPPPKYANQLTPIRELIG